MSIYATLWALQFPNAGERYFLGGNEDTVEVYAQAVAGHIRDVGPEWEWLPPPIDREDAWRAVVICGPYTYKGTERNGQEYVRPLLILTGEEYQTITWEKMLDDIANALERHSKRGNREGGHELTPLSSGHLLPHD